MNKPVLGMACCALLLTVVGCSSIPELKYPSGNNKIPINTNRAEPASIQQQSDPLQKTTPVSH